MTLFKPAWTFEVEHALAAYLNRRQRIIARLSSVLLGQFIYEGR